MNSRPPTGRSLFISISSILTALFLAVPFGQMRESMAADISREVRQGVEQTHGFLELGLNVGYFRLPIAGLIDSDYEPSEAHLGLGLVINGMVEWRGFFAEALYDSFGGVTVGYRALRNENSTLELVLTNTFAELDPEAAEFDSVQKRDPDIVFGLRSSWYLPNSIAQLSLLSDVSSTHNGFTASAQWGRTWQARNWNLHAMLGMRHFSRKVTDYYFGISPSESNDVTPVYNAKAGTMAELDFGAAVPLSENWLFRSGLQVYRLPGSVVDSPLTSERVAYEFSTGLFYVF